jgi:hypothetical protein
VCRLAAELGAKVKKGRQKEIGWYQIELDRASKHDPLWSDQPSRFVAFHWHGDIFDLPEGAVALASSDITPVQSYRFGDRAYGVLFHLQVTEDHIRRMLGDFASEIHQERLDPGAILEQSKCFPDTAATDRGNCFPPLDRYRLGIRFEGDINPDGLAAFLIRCPRATRSPA